MTMPDVDTTFAQQESPTNAVLSVNAETWGDPNYFRQVSNFKGGNDFPADVLPAFDDIPADLPANPALPEDVAESAVPEDVAKLAAEYGLQVKPTEQSGNTTYSFTTVSPDGETVEVAHGTDPASLRAEFDTKLQQEIAVLENTYNVDVLGAGDKTTKGATARNPTFQELAVLNYGLERSGPSALDEDYNSDNLNGLVFAYAAEDTSPSEAYYHPDENGNRAEIVFDPGSGQNEHIVIHELAHNGQFRYWEADDRSSEQYNEYLEKVGWKKLAPGKEVLVTSDDPPQYFRPISPKAWIRVDDQGTPLDENGNPTDRESAPVVSNNEVMERAKVTPATDYFTSAREHGAELVTVIREDESTRGALLHQNPQSYQIAVELDQEELNDEYGVDANGEPNKIRMPSGEIRDNSPENRHILAEWEASFKR